MTSKPKTVILSRSNVIIPIKSFESYSSQINLYCTAVFRDSHTELASHPGLLKWRERAKNVVTECKDGDDKSVLILQAS